MTRKAFVWLSKHRLGIGVAILALTVSYGVVLIVAGSEAAQAVGVAYTAIVVTGSFLLNLANWTTNR